MRHTLYIDRRRILALVLSAIPLLIGVSIAIGSVSTGLFGALVRPMIQMTLLEIVIQAVVTCLFGITVVLCLFWLLHQRRARRLVIALIVSPMLGFVSVFLGTMLLLILFKNTNNIFYSIMLFISLGISLMSMILILTDMLPPLIKSIFVAFYGSFFGVFIGVTMVTSTIVTLIIALILEDYVLIRFVPTTRLEQMDDQLGSDPFEYTEVTGGGTVVGVGDYIAYSLIGAHAIIFFPVHVWSLSLIMALLGMAINVFVLLSDEHVLPAIPLPASLALFPWIVHLLVL